MKAADLLSTSAIVVSVITILLVVLLATSRGQNIIRQRLDLENRAALNRAQAQEIGESIKLRTLTVETSRQGDLRLATAIEAAKRYQPALDAQSLAIGKLLAIEETDGKLRVTMELVEK